MPFINLTCFASPSFSGVDKEEKVYEKIPCMLNISRIVKVIQSNYPIAGYQNKINYDGNEKNSSGYFTRIIYEINGKADTIYVIEGVEWICAQIEEALK